MLTFATSDETSGISHYELAINDGEFIRVTSPYQLEPQPDGEHIITVKAVDQAGWSTAIHRHHTDRYYPAGSSSQFPGGSRKNKDGPEMG